MLKSKIEQIITNMDMNYPNYIERAAKAILKIFDEAVGEDKYLIDSMPKTCKHREGSEYSPDCGLSNNLSIKCKSISCGLFEVNMDEAVKVKAEVDGYNLRAKEIRDRLKIENSESISDKDEPKS